MLPVAFQKAIAPSEPMSWGEAMIVSGAALAAALPVLAGLYLVKSALGINLMDGPSPLHDLLYSLVL
ncbi:MAG: hypothetical protein ABL893_14535 [Hyphomicrobium sp.]